MCICPMSPSKAERNEVKAAEKRDGNVVELSSNTEKNAKITTKTVLTETRDGEKKRKKNALVRWSLPHAEFYISERYFPKKSIGKGAYGCVCEALDMDGDDDDSKRKGGQRVAIKKLTDIFQTRYEAKRTFLEIEFMRRTNHRNVVKLIKIEAEMTTMGRRRKIETCDSDDLDCDDDLGASSSSQREEEKGKEEEEEEDFSDVYLIMELMDTDLNQVIKSNQPLTRDHVIYFIYQTLLGLKHIHDCNILHRDLKPSNLLVNANCDLKICDFGLSRQMTPDKDKEVNSTAFSDKLSNGNSDQTIDTKVHVIQRTSSFSSFVTVDSPAQEEAKLEGAGKECADGGMTEYVVTRWYRAPELLVANSTYSEKIDVWSVGCILGEMLGRKPLFPGSDYIDQLTMIVNTLGTPCEKDMIEVESLKARKFIKSLNNGAPIPNIPFATIFPQADPLTIDLLQRMLEFNPKNRINVTEALHHPLFDGVRNVQQIRKDYCDGFQFLANTVKVSIPNEESNKPMDIEVYKQKIRQQISLTESTWKLSSYPI